jgi:uncharacterized protein YpiB (UPF0302 family)
MRKWISITEKRNFLKWFLDNHRLKSTDARKILEFIIHRPHLLENLSFVDKIKPREKTIVVSSMQSDESGFAFYDRYRKTEDASQALHDLTLNPSEKVNLILNFYGKLLNHRYLQMLDSPEADSIHLYEQSERHARAAEALIEKISHEQEIERVKRQIDEALDKNDRLLFEQLVSRLQELDKKQTG